MKKLLSLSLVLLALTVAGQAKAEEIKIGGVDFQKALNEVQQGKNAKASLKAEFDAKQKKLDLQQDELKRMQEEVQKQGGVLSQDALAQKQKVFAEKYMELQKNMGQYREELVQKEGRMTASILANMKSIVSEIGQKEGYSMIVETSQDAVLFAKVKEDLTSKVIAAYNGRFTGPLKMD